MRHEINADSVCLFCHNAQYKKGTLSQHFVMHVVSPLPFRPFVCTVCCLCSLLLSVNSPCLLWGPGFRAVYSNMRLLLHTHIMCLPHACIAAVLCVYSHL